MCCIVFRVYGVFLFCFVLLWRCGERMSIEFIRFSERYLSQKTLSGRSYTRTSRMQSDRGGMQKNLQGFLGYLELIRNSSGQVCRVATTQLAYSHKDRASLQKELSRAVSQGPLPVSKWREIILRFPGR